MNIREAWDAVPHGGAIVRPSGARVEKWVGEKPGMQPAFERFLAENANTIPSDDLLAQDWSPEV